MYHGIFYVLLGLRIVKNFANFGLRISKYRLTVGLNFFREIAMRYEVVDSFEQAVGLLVSEQGIARILAGGTDVLVQHKLGIVSPDLLIDIKNIPDAKQISNTPDGYRIGAAVSGAEMGENSDLKAAWPGVVEAMELIGSTQVQGRATLVGNLCNASPAADAVPALVAASAYVETIGPKGRRQLLVKDIPKSPGKTNLAKNELVTAIYIPKHYPRSGDAYLRFIPRTEMDIAVASAGVNLSLDAEGTITAAQIALGAVAPTVILVAEARKAILGSKLDKNALENLAAACRAACSPIDDKRGTIEFRTKVAGVLACRAAKIAYQRAGGTL